MPKSPPGGFHRVEVRNSTTETSTKKRKVSSKRTRMIPNVVKMDRYAQAASKTFISRSRVSLARLLRFQASGPDLVLPASSATENPPRSRDQDSTNTYDWDCLSAVCRSPPFGSPSALNTVPALAATS